MKVERILCPVDFSPASDAATAYAIDLAKRLGARIGLMHTVYANAGGAYADTLDLNRFYTMMRGEAQARMRRAQERYADAGVDLEPLLHEGPVVEELRHAAAEWKADLVVMATHGRHGFRRWVLGSTAEGLLRALPMPILTLTEPEAQRARSRLAHVVAAVDFPLEPEAAVLEAALGLAARHGARLTLLHVLHGVSTGVRQHYEQILMEALEQRLLATVPPDLKELGAVNVVVEAGAADQRLVEWAAREDVDLLVLGGRPKGTMARAVAGATLERLVREAKCPVLTVPAQPQ
ncbi:universal stress protein [Ectothiorhodospiraceae bacterium 2226]|nr:universal stress protein [Ectothiorhodospiraceae bacterium 2226]